MASYTVIFKSEVNLGRGGVAVEQQGRRHDANSVGASPGPEPSFLLGSLIILTVRRRWTQEGSTVRQSMPKASLNRLLSVPARGVIDRLTKEVNSLQRRGGHFACKVLSRAMYIQAEKETQAGRKRTPSVGCVMMDGYRGRSL